jgi:hypothetical protein
MDEDKNTAAEREEIDARFCYFVISQFLLVKNSGFFID